MGDIIEFKKGCYKCKYMMRVGDNTYQCRKLDFEDGSHIYPVVRGRHKDWGACDGESYKYLKDTATVKIKLSEDEKCQKYYQENY